MADPYGIPVQQGFGQFSYPGPAGAGDQTGQFVGFSMNQAGQAGIPAPPNMFGPQSLAFEAQSRAGFTDPSGMGLGANPAMALQPGMGNEFNAFGQFGEMAGMVGGQMNTGAFMQDPSMMGGRGLFSNGRGGRGGQRGGSNKFPGGGMQRNVNLPSVTNPDGLRDDTVFVSGLPQNVDHEVIKKEFGAIGKIKMNVKTNMPMVWIFKEKGIPRGDGLVTFEEPSCVQAAIDHFSKNDFKGHQISVKQATNAQRPVIIPPTGSNQGMMGNMGGFDDPMGGRRGASRGSLAMGGRGGMMDAKRNGDWTCGDCNNVNFAWRDACNRCGRASDANGLMMDPSLGMMMSGGMGPKSMINITPGHAQNRGGGTYRGGGGTMGGQMRVMGGGSGGRGGIPFGTGASGMGPPSRGGGIVGPGGAMMMLTPQPAGGPNMGRGGGPLRALGGATGPGGRPRPAPY